MIHYHEIPTELCALFSWENASMFTLTKSPTYGKPALGFQLIQLDVM